MDSYETNTTVGQHGDIHLAGVPFAPGSQVDVTVSPKTIIAEQDAVANLLAALSRAHNAKSVGPLNRDSLYDRNGIH